MRIREVWQLLVTGGADLGTNGTQRRTFLFTLGAVAVVAAFINTLGAIFCMPQYNLFSALC